MWNKNDQLGDIWRISVKLLGPGGYGVTEYETDVIGMVEIKYREYSITFLHKVLLFILDFNMLILSSYNFCICNAIYLQVWLA